MKFTLEITLGNDAMQSPADIAGALRTLAGRLGTIHGAAMDGETGTVMDLNGNTAGFWAVIREDDDNDEPAIEWDEYGDERNWDWRYGGDPEPRLTDDDDPAT